MPVSRTSGSDGVLRAPSGEPAVYTEGRPTCVVEYLFRRIREAGVAHTFGIPGDFALPLYAAQEESGLKTVVMTHEQADCILALGMLISDMDVGFDPARISRRRLIQATSQGVSVSYHHYAAITLTDVIEALLQSPELCCHPPAVRPPVISPPLRSGSEWGTAALIEELNAFLTPAHLVIADTGDCLFATVELRADWFIGPGYYASMGLAVPGAIGAQLARPDLRPVVLVGDGAFKMTGVELGTAHDLNLNPIVIVLNNRSFATLKVADRDREYYRVTPWDYVGIARCVGGCGAQVRNRAEFRAALRRAQAARGFFLIDALLPQDDASPTLRRLGKEYGGRIRMGGEHGMR